MRFLHGADLHIGKRVHERLMLEDQQYVLDQFLDIVEKEKVDAVLVAHQFVSARGADLERCDSESKSAVGGLDNELEYSSRGLLSYTLTKCPELKLILSAGIRETTRDNPEQ